MAEAKTRPRASQFTHMKLATPVRLRQDFDSVVAAAAAATTETVEVAFSCAPHLLIAMFRSTKGPLASLVA